MVVDSLEVEAAKENICQLKKNDRIKIYHPEHQTWKSVIVTDVRVRSCRIRVMQSGAQACRDGKRRKELSASSTRGSHLTEKEKKNSTKTSSSSVDNNTREWIDFTHLKFKRTRQQITDDDDDEGGGGGDGAREEEEKGGEGRSKGKGIHFRKKKKKTSADTAGDMKETIAFPPNDQYRLKSPLASTAGVVNSRDEEPKYDHDHHEDGAPRVNKNKILVKDVDGKRKDTIAGGIEDEKSPVGKKTMELPTAKGISKTPSFAPKTPVLNTSCLPSKMPVELEVETPLCQRRLDFNMGSKTSTTEGSKAENNGGERGSGDFISSLSACDDDGAGDRFNDVPSKEGTLRNTLAQATDRKGQTSSVAYMKESESKQIGLDVYKCLPHIMYRLNYLEAESPINRRTRYCINHSFFPAMACVLSLSSAMEFRDYILKPKERLQMLKNVESDSLLFKASSSEALQKHVLENTCILLHYDYCSDMLLKACTTENCVRKSNIQIVLHLKRCCNGTREINKLATSLSKSLKLSSLGFRIDLFISSELKNNLPKSELSSLLSVVGGFEKLIASSSIKYLNEKLLLKYLVSIEKLAESKVESPSIRPEPEPEPEPEPGLGETSMDRNQNQVKKGILESKGMSLHSFVQRVATLSSKVRDMKLDETLNQVKGNAKVVEFISKNSDFFSKGIFELVSSVATLMYINKMLTNGVPRNNFSDFHLLSRIALRDSFTYELIKKTTVCKANNGKDYIRTEFFFPPDSIPGNYKEIVPSTCYNDKERVYPVGVTTYTCLYDESELQKIEKRVEVLEEKISSGGLPTTSFHHSISNNVIRRTKTFFGARYLWTRAQTRRVDSDIANGIRIDVPPYPKWVKNLVEQPLLEANVLPDNFVNTVAINIYRDGSEGIQSHYDDSSRFARPVVSLRVFSDSRLSFGTQFFGYVNGSFYVPMPRGCVTIMEPLGYGANGIKHSVRPADMTGKSVAIILRQVHERSMREARALHMKDLISSFKSWTILTNQESMLSRQEESIRKECASVMGSIVKSVQKNVDLCKKEIKSKQKVKRKRTG